MCLSRFLFLSILLLCYACILPSEEYDNGEQFYYSNDYCDCQPPENDCLAYVCSYPWYILGCDWEDCCCGYGLWFPEEPALFKPFLADPRQMSYSVGYRFNDKVLHNSIIDVSFADTLAIYEWCNWWGGRLRFEIEGALWAVFSPSQESAPLVNADYYGGIAFTYCYDNWALRLRAFHISSHIGDEFLLMNPHFGRMNPSSEYIDLFGSYDLTNEIRLYGGLGWIFAQDESFHCSPFYGAVGLEMRLQSFGGIDWCQMLYATPFYGMHFRFSKDFKHHVDATYVLGYEWGKFTGMARKVRVYLEYHDGYSVEGQFCHHPTSYLSLRASYSY